MVDDDPPEVGKPIASMIVAPYFKPA
jgi:hypothetical protein